MDTTNHLSSTELLNQWWESKNFKGKEYCTLDENGALKVAPFKEKIVAILNPVTGDAVIQNLIEKFEELNKQIEDLKAEWNNSADKIKIMAKIQRLNEHLKNVHAIGNLQPLLDEAHNWERTVLDIIEGHYQQKLALVQEAEQLTVENNNWKELTQKLKDIGERWKSLGFVEKKRNDELWERFENIKNKFFEEKRIHQDDISKDLLQNLDLKLELVEKAEHLAESDQWKDTTELFKQLMEDWKKIGRTIPEKNEALWQRFIGAKNHFFDRKKAHTDQIKIEQENNYQKKLVIVEKAETIQNSTDWTITAQVFNELTAEWKNIGAVPSEFGNSLWERFSAAKDHFFTAKKEKAEAYKAMLEENFQKKQNLIEQAEAIKNSTNWRDATDEMNRLFDEWKQIGHVGKEHSEVLWEKFLSARKHFFNRKDQDRERRKQQFEKNKELHYIQTKNFLATLEAESKDEEAQITEFSENLKNNPEGPKAEEIKAQLNKLIIELEQRIKTRAKKIDDLKEQIAKMELEQNSKRNDQQV